MFITKSSLHATSHRPTDKPILPHRGRKFKITHFFSLHRIQQRVLLACRDYRSHATIVLYTFLYIYIPDNLNVHECRVIYLAAGNTYLLLDHPNSSSVSSSVAAPVPWDTTV